MSFNNQTSGVVNNAAGEAGVAMLSIAKNDKAFKEMLKQDERIFFCVEWGRFAALAYLNRGCVIRADDFSVSYDSVFLKHSSREVKNVISSAGLTMDKFGTINGVFKPEIEEAFGYQDVRCLVGNYEKAHIVGVFIPNRMKPMSFLKSFSCPRDPNFCCGVFSIQGTEEVGSDGYYRANVYATDTKRLIKFDEGAFKLLNANEKFYIATDTLQTLCAIFEKSSVVCIQKYTRAEGEYFYIFRDDKSKYALIIYCQDGQGIPLYDKVLAQSFVSDNKTSFEISHTESLRILADSAMGDVLFEYKDGDGLYISDFVNNTVCNKRKIGIEVISRAKSKDGGYYPNEAFLFDKKFLLSLLKNGNKLTLSVVGGSPEYIRTVYIKLDEMEGAYLSKRLER